MSDRATLVVALSMAVTPILLAIPLIGPFLALAVTTLPIIAVCWLGSLRSLFRLPGRPA